CTSTLTRHSALERVQSALFTGIFRRSAGIQPQLIRGSVTIADLFFVAERVLGWSRANALFDAAHVQRGAASAGHEVSPEFISSLEKELAGSIGSASAHILLRKVMAGDDISLEEVMWIA